MFFFILFVYTMKCCTALIDTPKLIALDGHLTKLLVEPQPGKGKELLEESEFLCKNLDEVSDLIDEKKPEGSEIYKVFEKAGGLKFINASYNPEQLKQTYNFGDDDLAYLKTTLVEIKSIWKCIEVMLNVSLPDSGEHFYENLAAKIRENQRLRGEPENINVTSSMETSELYS